MGMGEGEGDVKETRWRCFLGCRERVIRCGAHVEVADETHGDVFVGLRPDSTATQLPSRENFTEQT